ncbi:MAG: VWA domain-containing protein [Myxococcales bacterium]
MRRAGWLLAVLPLTGCGVFRHVTVEPLATTSQRPSNIGAYVSVSDGDTPLTELQPSNFRVYENEQLVPSDQTQLTLLDPNLVAAHQVVLLVDMSNAQTQEARTLVAKGALNFVQKVTPREAVSVFAFDGGPALVPIAAFPRGNQGVTMAALESFTPRDPSRNLNGAVVAGLAKLEMLLTQSGKVVRVGTLVVYSGGPDVAGRVDRDKAHDQVWESPYDVLAIGVAEQADAVEDLARRGLVRAQRPDTLPIAFEEAASQTLEQLEKHYLVSYCSPARAGSRRLRLEVSYTNKEGEEHHGDFEFDFSAKSFGPGCNPQMTPRFTLTPKAEPEPEPKRDQDRERDWDASKTSKTKKAPPDAREHDQGEDAPVAPPDQSGYAK